MLKNIIKIIQHFNIIIIYYIFQNIYLFGIFSSHSFNFICSEWCF